MSSDPNNCGNCGLPCTGGTCSASVCYLASCNGVTDGLACGTPGAGFTCCGSGCVDPATSNSDCGACGQICPNDSQCSGFGCSYVDAGFAACATSADCPAGSGCTSSFAGICSPTSCSAPSQSELCARADGGAGLCCSSACVDSSSDANNCNGCGVTCSLACVSSTCTHGYVDGGATVGSCSFDGGAAASCNPAACANGYTCDNRTCVLNGASGAAQVTLRWGLPVDLDLHVVEPSGCEVYYGNRTCVGALDLDSNPACNIDNLDTENIIYPGDGGALPSGTYTVRVDFYEDCNSAPDVPYEVIVRSGGVTTNYCGDFSAANADFGAAQSGATVATFSIP